MSLADELRDHTDEIVHRWYLAWKSGTGPPPEGVSEAALKDHLVPQLRLIAEQLRDLAGAESPETLWQVGERLDPESRVLEEVPIGEVVQEYRLAVDVVRDWIAERGIEVSFGEYSYFYGSIFELAAESVRRYAKRQAELVSRSRAEYLAAVMHQLRTPLSTLAVGLQRLERDAGHPDSATMSKLARGVRRIAFLVNGVLRLERYRPEETPVRPRDVSPAREVQALLADLEHEAIRKGLHLEERVSPTLRMTLDPDLFADGLGNLLQNALKFTSSGFVVVEADEEEDAVTFRVRDSGPGIPPERRESLFRLQQPGSQGGAGIGLLIARHAALAQGGEIGVESEVGRGSTFWIRLPRRVPARKGAADGGLDAPAEEDGTPALL
jgi:signal transduction histidine kinase